MKKRDISGKKKNTMEWMSIPPNLWWNTDSIILVNRKGRFPFGFLNQTRESGLFGINSFPFHSITLNQTHPKFLENGIISRSDLSRNTVPKKDHLEPPISSNGLIVIHNTPQVQPDIEQPIAKVPQITENNPGDQITQELPETVEQPVEQHAP